jgi:hypothetical protein
MSPEEAAEFMEKWWTWYEVEIGVPGERPESYWVPRYAEVCHLRPADLGDLTSGQMHAMYRYSHPKGSNA